MKKENPRKTLLNFRNNLIMLYKNLPENELYRVMRVRLFLDYLAAFVFLLKGDKNNSLAVLRARKEYMSMRFLFKAERDENLRSASLVSIPERFEKSILWWTKVRRCKFFSDLPWSR